MLRNYLEFATEQSFDAEFEGIIMSKTDLFESTNMKFFRVSTCKETFYWKLL